jgi:hypothetical protein
MVVGQMEMALRQNGRNRMAGHTVAFCAITRRSTK